MIFLRNPSNAGGLPGGGADAGGGGDAGGGF